MKAIAIKVFISCAILFGVTCFFAKASDRKENTDIVLGALLFAEVIIGAVALLTSVWTPA